MPKIHLCFDRYRKEVAEWLGSGYELTTELPSDRFDLCFVDYGSIDSIAKHLRAKKESDPAVFMPVVLVLSDEEFAVTENHIDKIVDEVILEPLRGGELNLRVKNLLRTHYLSFQAKKLQENEMKLELQAQRLANLSENVPGMIYQFAVYKDQTAKFEYISEGCREIFELEPQQGLKDPGLIISTVHPDEREKFERELADAISANREFLWEGRYLINGKLKWIKAASTPHKADYAMVWDGVMIDVSDVKKTEAKLRSTVGDLQNKNRELAKLNSELDDANEKLRNIDKAKTKFISTAAHEIRTPLTSILGFVQTILSPEIQLTKDLEAEYLKIVENETRRLSQLVDTMLNISRLDAGRQELNLRSVDIAPLLQDVVNSLSSEVKQDIEIRIVANARGIVCADSQQIGLVVRNLLDNAIRYTEPGGLIQISVDKVEEDGEIVVGVRDRGPGIPSDKLESIFEKFYRIRKDTSTAGRGSGLGLSIAQEIIRAHKGRIWAQSVLGKGSTFFFTLPVVDKAHRG
ncbi:LuxR family transcriptional regulator, partial [Chitinispirillum alkaliphilum]